MKTKLLLEAFPLASALACYTFMSSGCSSVMSHTGPNQGYYLDTRAIAAILVDDESSWALKLLALIDLPFSTVLNTMLLPWDYARSDYDRSIPRVSAFFRAKN